MRGTYLQLLGVSIDVDVVKASAHSTVPQLLALYRYFNVSIVVAQLDIPQPTCTPEYRDLHERLALPFSDGLSHSTAMVSCDLRVPSVLYALCMVTSTGDHLRSNARSS